MSDGTIWIRFVIPNRDDPDKDPTFYEEQQMMTVPREGETVILNEVAWVVKWVEHDLDESAIHVRLIEPHHWTRR